MSNNQNLLPYQQYCELLNRQGGTYNIITSCEITEALTPEMIREALDMAQSRHPYLNCRIIEKDNFLQFTTEGTQKIPLEVVDKLHDKHWQEIINEEINREIDSSKCLMRAVLIYALNEKDSKYLITTIHHSIADGLSCIQLQSEILNYCQKIASGENLTQVIPLPLLPSLPTLLRDLTISSQLDESYPEKDVLGFEKWVPIKNRRSVCIYKYLDENLTQQLKKKARLKKTTMHGVFCAAMLLATARIIRDNQRIEFVRASCATYFDLRPYLKFTVGNEHLSFLAWEVISSHTLETNTSFWDLSREVRQQIRSILKSGAFISEILSEEVDDYINILAQEVIATVDVSNLGKVNIPTTYGKFELEEINCLSGTTAFAGMASLFVTEFKEKILLSFLFSEPSVSQARMEILVNDVISNFIHACN